MNNLKTVVAFAVGSLFAGAAFAQSNYSIEQRDRIEQARIDRGVQSGQLTSREADRLQDQRTHIERLQSRARADGTLTRNERFRIDAAQDRLGRDIYRQTHDRQTANGNGQRPNGWGRGYGIEQRDRFQQARIDRGVQSGQFTSREADRLQDGRARIERMESRARSDGRLTRNERARIDGAQDRLGRAIYRQSHDNQTANGNGNRPNGSDRGNGNGATPRSGGDNRADRSDRGAGRQASMPQAQARSTQSTPRAARQVTAARQGGDSARRTR